MQALRSVRRLQIWVKLQVQAPRKVCIAHEFLSFLSDCFKIMVYCRCVKLLSGHPNINQEQFDQDKVDKTASSYETQIHSFYLFRERSPDDLRRRVPKRRDKESFSDSDEGKSRVRLKQIRLSKYVYRYATAFGLVHVCYLMLYILHSIYL